MKISNEIRKSHECTSVAVDCGRESPLLRLQSVGVCDGHKKFEREKTIALWDNFKAH